MSYWQKKPFLLWLDFFFLSYLSSSNFITPSTSSFLHCSKKKISAQKKVYLEMCDCISVRASSLQARLITIWQNVGKGLWCFEDGFKFPFGLRWVLKLWSVVDSGINKQGLFMDQTRIWKTLRVLETLNSKRLKKAQMEGMRAGQVTEPGWPN